MERKPPAKAKIDDCVFVWFKYHMGDKAFCRRHITAVEWNEEMARYEYEFDKLVCVANGSYIGGIDPYPFGADLHLAGEHRIYFIGDELDEFGFEGQILTLEMVDNTA